MHLKRFYIGFIIIFAALSSCIEPYLPKEIEQTPDLYVVSGQVVDTSAYQQITVSKASSLEFIRFKPINDCLITIVDCDNNVFQNDTLGHNGVYKVWVDPQLLTPGKAFKVIINTSDNIVIESDYDTLKPNPNLNDVYFHRDDKPTTDPNVFERGIQFKIDLDADETFDRFFLWEVEETFEYRASYPIEVYWLGEFIENEEPDWSKYYCWKTDKIKSIFTLSTKGLVENKFSGYNLHFVNNRTQRLMHLYSIKVSQMAISETYYNYLEQIRINSSEQGGLFDTQPIAVNGNMHSPSHPDLRILGFFGVASSQSKRFFVSDVENLPFEIPYDCSPLSLAMIDFSILDPTTILYLVVDEGFIEGWASPMCFDCTTMGGTTEKPNFWPYK